VSTKITCPVCGEPGYIAKVRHGNHVYIYVDHFVRENGRVVRHKHYLGKDTSVLRQELEQVIGSKVAKKILSYLGGDYYIADILLPRIEGLCTFRWCTFVEVFGGSGYISQVIDRKRFTNVVYNDIDDRLTTLYRVIKENPEKFALLLTLLPYGRSYHTIIKELLKSANKDVASLIMASLFFYTLNSSFFGGGGFAYVVRPDKNNNAARKFRSKTWAILKFADAWKDITIENMDFRVVIKKYDTPQTVFYFDPPYPDRAKSYYGHAFTVDDLRELAGILTTIKGRFLLKLDDRTYGLVRDILREDEYRVERIETILNQRKVNYGNQKGRWVLVLVSNAQVINQ